MTATTLPFTIGTLTNEGMFLGYNEQGAAMFKTRAGKSTIPSGSKVFLGAGKGCAPAWSMIREITKEEMEMVNALEVSRMNRFYA